MRLIHRRMAAARRCRWHRTLRIAVLVTSASLPLSMGCGKPPEIPVEIRGRVTVADDPIEIGSIRFIPESGFVTAPFETEIKNGEFVVRAAAEILPGLYSVSINGRQRTGKKITIKRYPGTLSDEVRGMVAKRYNSAKSGITALIKPGMNKLKYKLDKKSDKEILEDEEEIRLQREEEEES